MDIPPEIQIRSTVKSGSVYYFEEELLSSPEPHFFIVLNIDPHSDTALILVCASSKIEKVRERRKNFPSSTLVEIAPAEYEDFTVRTIIDCNNIFEKSTGQLVEKMVQGKLRLKTEMSEHLITQLRDSVLLSPTVETRIKNMLRK